MPINSITKTNLNILSKGIFKSLIYPTLVIVSMKIAELFNIEVSFWDFIQRLSWLVFLSLIFGIYKTEEEQENKMKYRLRIFALCFWMACPSEFLSKIYHVLPLVTYPEILYSIFFIFMYQYFYLESNIRRQKEPNIEAAAIGLIFGVLYPTILIISIKIAEAVHIKISWWNFIFTFLAIAFCLSIIELRNTKDKITYRLQIFFVSFAAAYITQILLKLSYLFLPITIAKTSCFVAFIAVYSFFYYKMKLQTLKPEDLKSSQEFSLSRAAITFLAIATIILSIKSAQTIQKISKNAFMSELRNAYWMQKTRT